MSEDEEKCLKKLDEMKIEGVVTIGDDILQPIFKFLEYCLLGAFHLNEFGASRVPKKSQMNPDSKKRKRIVERMAKGLISNKIRRFQISKVKECFQCYTSNDIEEQIKILVAHVIIERSSRKSVGLVQNLSEKAESYLKSHCMHNDEEIAAL